jgi:di/tricarboxylate transporter
MIVVGVLSAFINNTPIVVMFIPIVLALARQYGISPSKLLLPLSFSAMFGGSCTVIGTSTNVLVSLLSAESGHGSFEMFEPTRLGAVLFVVGIAYMSTLGMRLTPARPPLITLEPEGREQEFAAELEVGPRSPLIGIKLSDTQLVTGHGVRVGQVIREETVLHGRTNDVVLRVGDVLLLSGKPTELVDIQQKRFLRLPEELDEEGIRFDPRNMMLIEFLVRPDGDWVGQTIAGLKLRERRGVTVMGLQRGRYHLREKLSRVALKAGDIVLAFGEENVVRNFASTSNYIVMDDVQEHVVYRGKSRLAVGLLAGIVIGASAFRIHILPLALAGAVGMVLGRCVSLKEAYRAIDFRLLILIGGMMALGRALGDTGLAQKAAFPLLKVGELGPWAVIGGAYLIATLLAAVITTASAAVLLVPIVLEVAAGLGYQDPTALLMAVMFGAAACFLSPIGYQTNIIVYTPGNYRFTDFARVGAPLTVLFLAVATFLIPLLWPVGG